MNLKYFLFVTLCFGALLDLSATNDLMKFRHLDVDDGLSNNQVHCVYKDHSGFLWVGTMGGLNRYDGTDFKIYKHDPQDSTSIRDNFVLKILEDEEHYLWLLSRNSSLCFYDPITDHFITDRPLLNKNIPIPRTNISDINKDSKGRIWITNDYFGIYIYDFKADSVIFLHHLSDDNSSVVSDAICSMAEDTAGNYWFVNKKGVIEKMDHKTLKVIERVPVFVDAIDHDENFRLYVDKDNDVWVYSESKSLGVKQYSSTHNFIHTYTQNSGEQSITNNVVKSVVQGFDGRIYIGMDHGGLSVINKSDATITAIKNIKGDFSSLPDNSITTLYYDNTGILWLGMYKRGMACYHPDFFKFTHYRDNPVVPTGLNYSDINCFSEDGTGKIWIGSNGGGLFVFDRDSRSFKSYKYNSKTSSDLDKDVVLSLLHDSQGRMWIGTYWGGLYLIEGDKISHYTHQSDDPKSISNDRVWNVFEDSRHNIWIGTLGGGVDLLKPSNDGFVHYKSGAINSIGSDYIFSIEEDDDGNVWFATVYGISILDWKSQRFYTQLNDLHDEKTITNNKTLVVKCDSRGWCWVGTYDGLNVFDKQSNTFRRFRKDDGLPDNTILSIEEDSSGNLWMGTPNGLANIQISQINSVWDFNYSINTYDVSDGLQGGIFNERASYKTHDGYLLFGGVNGFNIFNPQTIKSVTVEKHMVLLDFELFNKVVVPGEVINGRQILQQSLLYTKELELKHDENFFSISFTALDFHHPKKLNYQYKLDGFNDSWFTADPDLKKATFTNLNYGTYNFRVRVSEDGKDWCHQEANLTIHILPPLWASHWAFVVYVIIFIALLFLLRGIILYQERLKYQRDNEHKEVLRNEELNQLKMKFFTNVSHEFRTPLTLIISPLKKIMDGITDESKRKQLELVERNAKRLLGLINQLLDFRKMEVAHLSVNLSLGDLTDFLQKRVESFKDYAIENKIQLHFSSELDTLQCFFDFDKFEKIIVNLLSNAFKFTPEHGEVTVDLSLEKEDEDAEIPHSILIKICDTGIGISPAKIPHIFERFYQDEESKEAKFQGSGIGLALTKEFVELHEGEISVTSELGKGSCFSVRIPINRTGAKVEEIEEQSSTPQVADEIIADSPSDVRKATVLIVEDNNDLRFFLNENLKETYHTLVAPNGKEGLKLIELHRPDMVVCDIVMPLMSGIELCAAIKNDANYSHIPIILLTARTTDEHKLEGLKVGADDYITKPFSFEILEAKIHNILNYRKHLHSLITSTREIKPSEVCVTSLDEKLFQKAIDVVNDNLEDSDFSIEQMAQLMGVSRSQLYNKLIGITGKTPAEFIKIMRLKRAAQLLVDSQLTISEISYEVGYNGPRYFTKHFKELYGKTPSQYIKSVHADEGDDVPSV